MQAEFKGQSRDVGKVYAENLGPLFSPALLSQISPPHFPAAVVSPLWFCGFLAQKDCRFLSKVLQLFYPHPHPKDTIWLQAKGHTSRKLSYCHYCPEYGFLSRFCLLFDHSPELQELFWDFIYSWQLSSVGALSPPLLEPDPYPLSHHPFSSPNDGAAVWINPGCFFLFRWWWWCWCWSCGLQDLSSQPGVQCMES